MARAKKRSLPKRDKKESNHTSEEVVVETDVEEIEEAVDASVEEMPEAVEQKKKESEDDENDRDEDTESELESEDDEEDSDDEEEPEDDADESDTDEEDIADKEMAAEMDSGELEVMPMEMETDITTIYDIDDEGEDIDMSTLDQGPGRLRKWVIGVLSLIIVSLVGYLGYMFYDTSLVPVEEGSVELAVEVDEKVASGDVVTIELEYVNKKRAALEESEIEFIFPDGFQFHTATPAASDELNRVWSIDQLQSGAGGTIKITGQMLGEKDEIKDVSALWSYTPVNFSQLFQESIDASVMITSSVLETTVEAPEQARADEEVTYKLQFVNTSSVPLERVRATVQYPEGFTYTESSQPTTNSDENEWEWDSIQPEEEQTIEIKGTVAGESGDEQVFVAEIGVIEIDGLFNKQIERTSEFVIVNPELELSIDAPTSVQAGDDATITVTVENTSDVAIKNVDVLLTMSGEMFADAEKQFATIEKLKKGATQEFTYETTLGAFTGASSAHTVTASIVGATVNDSVVSFDNTAEAQLQVQGNVVFSAEGRFYDEDLTRIGSGVLPPQVGEETTYVVRWVLTNNSNELEDVTLKTNLPSGVLWADSASSGVEYNEDTRTVRLKQSSLEFGEVLLADFEVTISPVAADVNKLLPLTGEMTMTATDAVTGEPVTDSAARITTDLPDDEGAAGKGVVEA